eukprot:31457-Pelagococcus_subviridis.AAC.19
MRNVLILRAAHEHHVLEQSQPSLLVRELVQVAVLAFLRIRERDLSQRLGALPFDRPQHLEPSLEHAEPGARGDAAEVPQVRPADAQERVQPRQKRRHRRVRQRRADDQRPDGVSHEGQPRRRGAASRRLRRRRRRAPRRPPAAPRRELAGLELGHDLRDLLREPRAHGRDGFHRLLVVHDAHVRVRVGRDEPDERGSGQSSKAKEMSDGVVR